MSYQKHHSPVSEIIPEDAPLVENLKVVRPLNQIKNDTINYHQIIRCYNVPKPITMPKPAERQNKLRSSMEQSNRGSAPPSAVGIASML